MRTASAAPPAVSAARRAGGAGLALVAGVALAVQSRINGELSVRLDDPIGAATISFGSGLLVLAVGDRIGHPSALALAILPLVAGLGIAWQQAVNGHVGAVSGSAMVAGLVNFFMGTAVLLVALAVSAAWRGLPDELPRGPWWLYVGGLLGIVFIALGAAVVRYTGVLLLGLGMIAGQVLGALLVDTVVPGVAGRPGWNTVLGAVLTLVAVAVAVLPSRRAA